MNERDGYPAGVSCWVETAQPDPQAAAEFYGGLFGWEFEETAPAGAGFHYLIGRLGGRDVAAVASPREGAGDEPAWTTYVAVDSADEAAARVRAAGGTVLAGPADVPGAGRMAAVADPLGAWFGLWQAGGFAGAGLVNAPGSWNFSQLTTPDPDGAEAFYRAALGWELNRFSGGGTDSAMLRMPGYGDHLAAMDPGFRERMAAAGAPEGFEDAVAWLIPAGEEAPPRWSVTFSVDDADAAAARAQELGGTVLVPPTDAPWVRMTVLRDPQGASFTASKYVPPEPGSRHSPA